MWYSYYFKKTSMIKTSQEFWINDSGQSLFADGDIGDQNHEGIVIDQILYNNGIDPTMEDFNEMSDQELLSRGLSQEELDCVRGKIDARDYGMKHFGWARIMGTNAQVFSLSSKTMSNLADGWYEIFGEDAMNLNYTIEVGPPGQTIIYEDIPWVVIESDDISQLYEYLEIKRR